MATIKGKIGFSAKADKDFELTQNTLKKVTQHLIKKTKARNGYLVIADKNGKIEKIPAKDL